MNLKSVTAFLLFFVGVSAQEISTYTESISDGFIVYADNAELCPVSVRFEWQLVNMKPDKSNIIFVVPAKAKNFKVTEVKRVDASKTWRGEYKYWYNYGDATTNNPDDYVYNLPFEKDKEFTVVQGYDGKFSHQNENMLDFSMSEGEAVHAVREGLVVKVVQTNSKNCPFKDCAQYNNLILVQHKDGSYAEYLHIRKNGALVNSGDMITKGQHIAYSGNVGWSKGPHLHLTIFMPGIDKKRSMKTKFLTGDGNTSEYLKEKSVYKRLY